ncbi:MAG: Uncharacterised protein [Flavobacteriia bacterium]|nr:MAG: Uncharacterised protein [Flavobacteriia bacterium]
MSSRRMSVIITARKITINSSIVKREGVKMPLRATSIIPLEKTAPRNIPTLAMISTVRIEATFEPMAEFRKFTASLLTPTIRSTTANVKRIPMTRR